MNRLVIPVVVGAVLLGASTAGAKEPPQTAVCGTSSTRRLAPCRPSVTSGDVGFKSLAEGAKVEYEVDEGSKGPQARDVSVVNSV